MNMWESITHSQWFRNNSFVSPHSSLKLRILILSLIPKLLFLNNYDIFGMKIAYSDIKNHFPVRKSSLNFIDPQLEGILGLYRQHRRHR